MIIEKNNHVFHVTGRYSERWFKNGKLNKWEPQTFHILDYYRNNTDGIYIDIGAWIGPTVLYAAGNYKKVVAIEPDPVAYERLVDNIKANKFPNIILYKKAISDKEGEVKFGGNGSLGNSESSLLVAEEDYLTYEGRHTQFWEDDHEDIIDAETTTIENCLKEVGVEGSMISLIKMDIEGGEKIVIPAIKDFLRINKPIFYISLHDCFLRPKEVEDTLTHLFDVYDYCYVFLISGEKVKVSKEEVKRFGFKNLVFEP